MKNSHTPEKNFQSPKNVSFDEESGFTVVELDMEAYGLQKQGFHFQGKHFQPKDELHITILSSDAAEQVMQHLKLHPEAVENIRRLTANTNWNYRKLERFYHVVEEPGVETVIQMVEVQGLEPFFRELENILEAKLELPPTHVTLYTLGTSTGIGLPTQAVFERLVKEEVNPAQLNPPDEGEIGSA